MCSHGISLNVIEITTMLKHTLGLYFSAVLLCIFLLFSFKDQFLDFKLNIVILYHCDYLNIVILLEYCFEQLAHDAPPGV